MDIYKLKDLTVQDRKDQINAMFSKAEEKIYMKPLTREELAIRKDEMAEATIMLNTLEEEFKQIKEAHKIKVAPHEVKQRAALDAIRNQAVEVKGNVYTIPDHDNNMIHEVTEEGQVLASRPMLPNERQYRINTLNQAI